jgi:hypothetical protein
MRYVVLLLALLMTATAAESDLTGKFAGDWKSNGGGGNGSFTLTLEPGAGGAWKCDVMFTFGGADVKTKIVEVKVDQSKLEAAYDFDLMGNTLRSRIKGELKAGKIEGTYQTTSPDGGTPVDDGVWNAAKAK